MPGVARIDAAARSDIERRRDARRRWKETDDPADRRASIATRILTVHRTDADPRFTDPSLDPSARTYGSLWGTRPDWTNYGVVGFSRVVTPEAWLSTWSGLSSRAEIPRTGGRVTLPCLHIAYTADHCIFPTDADLVCESLATDDLTRLELPADHYGLPRERGRLQAVRAIREWLHNQ